MLESPSVICNVGISNQTIFVTTQVKSYFSNQHVTLTKCCQSWIKSRCSIHFDLIHSLKLFSWSLPFCSTAVMNYCSQWLMLLQLPMQTLQHWGSKNDPDIFQAFDAGINVILDCLSTRTISSIKSFWISNWTRLYSETNCPIQIPSLHLTMSSGATNHLHTYNSQEAIWLKTTVRMTHSVNNPPLSTQIRNQQHSQTWSR